MTEQTPILNNPTTAPVNDIDQIRVNVGTTGTGDYSFRNVAIPGRMENHRQKKFIKNLLYLVEPVGVPPPTEVSL